MIEVFGVTFDFSTIPIPIYIIIVIIFFGLIWYVLVYLGVAQENDELKTIQAEKLNQIESRIANIENSISVILSLVKTLSEKGVITSASIEKIEKDINGISAKYDDRLGKIYETLKQNTDTINRSISDVSMHVTENYRIYSEKLDSTKSTLEKDIEGISSEIQRLYIMFSAYDR